MFQMDITRVFRGRYGIVLSWQIYASIAAYAFVDCTMTNIQNYSLSEIVTSVPKGGIWRDVNFVRFPDAIHKFLILWGS
jgi:hypothetical protein